MGSANADFIEALRWRNNDSMFKKYIESSYDLCRHTKSQIVRSLDKMHLYSLLIACGFIYKSEFGNNYANGLRHIFEVLGDMNNDIKLRKDIGTALGSKLYWKDDEKQLIAEMITFAVRCNLFISQIQKLCRQNKQRMIK